MFEVGYQCDKQAEIVFEVESHGNWERIVFDVDVQDREDVAVFEVDSHGGKDVAVFVGVHCDKSVTVGVPGGAQGAAELEVHDHRWTSLVL